MNDLKTNDLTHDQIEAAVQLTPRQLKATKTLKRAIKNCEKLNVKFYTVLESIHFLNGNHIERIHDEGDFGDPNRLCGMPSEWHFNSGFAGWADDPHYVSLNYKGIEFAKELNR